MNFYSSRLKRGAYFFAFRRAYPEYMPCKTRCKYARSRSALTTNFIFKRSLLLLCQIKTICFCKIQDLTFQCHIKIDSYKKTQDTSSRKKLETGVKCHEPAEKTRTILHMFRFSFYKLITLITPFYSTYFQGISTTATQYISGLLCKISCKNIEQLSVRVHRSNYDALHNVTSESTWSSQHLNQQIVKKTSILIGGKQSALIVGETTFTKKGKMSVVVARQWNGRIGRLDNCQVGIFASLCNKVQSTLFDFRLYLHKVWACNAR
jgi:hypothetical protein